MKTAKATDWQTEALPLKKTTIALSRIFSLQEMQAIRRGLVPEKMEDKWFIYWENDTLFFHRSWTGFCVYVVRFAVEGDGYTMIKADVNRDPEQYTETSDSADAEMISFLVDVLLLHKDSDFPCNEPSSEKQALMKWSKIGRAALGQHPNHK